MPSGYFERGGDVVVVAGSDRRDMGAVDASRVPLPVSTAVVHLDGKVLARTSGPGSARISAMARSATKVAIVIEARDQQELWGNASGGLATAITQLDPESGVRWVRVSSGECIRCGRNSLAVSPTGDVYFGGYTLQPKDFGSGAVMSGAAFAFKFANDGHVVWQQSGTEGAEFAPLAFGGDKLTAIDNAPFHSGINQFAYRWHSDGTLVSTMRLLESAMPSSTPYLSVYTTSVAVASDWLYLSGAVGERVLVRGHPMGRSGIWSPFAVALSDATNDAWTFDVPSCGGTVAQVSGRADAMAGIVNLVSPCESLPGATSSNLVMIDRPGLVRWSAPSTPGFAFETLGFTDQGAVIHAQRQIGACGAAVIGLYATDGRQVWSEAVTAESGCITSVHTLALDDDALIALSFRGSVALFGVSLTADEEDVAVLRVRKGAALDSVSE